MKVVSESYQNYDNGAVSFWKERGCVGVRMNFWIYRVIVLIVFLHKHATP
jgi:hypothetical protein